MTRISSPTSAEESPATSKRFENLWHWIDLISESLTDRLNPILVKEARQALKSRQFSLTFAALLAAGWLWSFFGLAMLSHRIGLRPSGPEMLLGYILILAFALMVIVPFSAFRSLVAERDDGTFELLSITTLAARQIVSGKLGSSALQMIVYLSAMSPFITFTYLLRGIDIVTIALLLFYAAAACIAFSVAGLFLATLARDKLSQTFLTVGTIAALLFAYFLAMALIGEFLTHSIRLPVEELLFWVGQLALISVTACLGMLCFLAAAAQLTFESENRSTKLRAMMLIESAVFVGWLLFFWAMSANDRIPRNEPAIVCMSIIGVHWAVLGAMMVGESPKISRRVRRRLPVSSLGRAFLTWFNPGPSTGYFFAIANMAATVIFLLLISSLSQGEGVSLAVKDGRVARFGFLLTCYLAIFLGIGRLLMLLYRHRRSTVGIVISLLIQSGLILFSILVPIVVQGLVESDMLGSYTLLQVSNPFWTLAEVGFSDDFLTVRQPLGSSGRLVFPVTLVLSVTASIVLTANLLVATKQIGLFRAAKPQRIQDDDIAQHPELAPQPPQRQSPWD